MSRFALALCALLVAVTPRVALPYPAFPDNFERPAAHRHAINAVLGDLSFIHHYGIPQPPGTDADTVKLCIIQPQYHPVFNVQVTQDSDRAPATVSVTGNAQECCCGIKYVAFDFGDGAMWRSPEVNNYYYVPVHLAPFANNDGGVR